MPQYTSTHSTHGLSQPLIGGTISAPISKVSMFSGLSEGLFDFLSGTFYYPQTAAVESSTLCTLNRALQFCVILYIIASLFLRYLWVEDNTLSTTVNFWQEQAFYVNATRAFRGRNLTLPYCNNDTYNFRETAGETDAHFTCVTPTYHELQTQRPTGFFVPTMFVEYIVEQGNCAKLLMNSSTCDAKSASWTVYPDAQCMCTLQQSYFVVAPEAMNVSLSHYYWEKDLDIKGGITNMKSIIQDYKGNDRDTYNDVSYITYPIKTWLEFGGLGLDDFNKEAQPTLPGSEICGYGLDCSNLTSDGGNFIAKYPYNRLTGAELNIHVKYINPRSFTSYFQINPIAHIEVEAINGWIEDEQRIDYLTIPELPTFNPLIDGAGTYYKYAYTDYMKFKTRAYRGLRVNIFSSGSVESFDVWTLQTVLVTGLVYMNLVPTIVLYIALMCYAEKREEISDQIFVQTTGRAKMTQVYRRLVKDLCKKTSGKSLRRPPLIRCFCGEKGLHFSIHATELSDVIEQDVADDADQGEIETVINQLMDQTGYISFEKLHRYLTQRPAAKLTEFVNKTVLRHMISGPLKRELQGFLENEKLRGLGLSGDKFTTEDTLEIVRTFGVSDTSSDVLALTTRSNASSVEDWDASLPQSIELQEQFTPILEDNNITADASLVTTSNFADFVEDAFKAHSVKPKVRSKFRKGMPYAKSTPSNL